MCSMAKRLVRRVRRNCCCSGGIGDGYLVGDGTMVGADGEISYAGGPTSTGVLRPPNRDG